jgi:hypothetical protein
VDLETHQPEFLGCKLSSMSSMSWMSSSFSLEDVAIQPQVAAKASAGALVSGDVIAIIGILFEGFQVINTKKT